MLHKQYPKNGPGEGKGDTQDKVELQPVRAQERLCTGCGIASCKNHTAAAKDGGRGRKVRRARNAGQVLTRAQFPSMTAYRSAHFG